jgi:hypothetical protein
LSKKTKGTKKEKKTRVYLPDDIASWIKRPEAIPQVRKLMVKGK